MLLKGIEWITGYISDCLSVLSRKGKVAGSEGKLLIFEPKSQTNTL